MKMNKNFWIFQEQLKIIINKKKNYEYFWVLGFLYKIYCSKKKHKNNYSQILKKQIFLKKL